MKTVKIGLLGFGVVGQGIYQTLKMNSATIVAKTGVALEIEKILVRDEEKALKNGADKALLTRDISDIIENPEIDIVVEVMGGVEPASAWLLAAMGNGKHVVTANKAAVAANYEVLVSASRKHQVMLRYEAAVAGGIPILDALQAPLNSNDIESVSGIVNGTTNFILTQMAESGLEYSEALKLAQERGFAEADPTADVAGIDAANKLIILTAIAFGQVLRLDEIPTTGISELSAEDIRLSAELGYKIKLLASVEKKAGKLQASVQPTLVADKSLFAAVGNEYNALFVTGNAVDDLFFYGKGAGAMPTASAVTGDIIEIANALSKNAAYDSYVNAIPEGQLEFVGEGVNAYLVRLEVDDEAGSLSQVTQVLAKFDISVKSVLQKERGQMAEIIFLLHEVAREKLDAALSEMPELGAARKVEKVMRVLE